MRLCTLKNSYTVKRISVYFTSLASVVRLELVTNLLREQVNMFCLAFVESRRLRSTYTISEPIQLRSSDRQPDNRDRQRKRGRERADACLVLLMVASASVGRVVSDVVALTGVLSFALRNWHRQRLKKKNRRSLARSIGPVGLACDHLRRADRRLYKSLEADISVASCCHCLWMSVSISRSVGQSASVCMYLSVSLSVSVCWSLCCISVHGCFNLILYVPCFRSTYFDPSASLISSFCSSSSSTFSPSPLSASFSSAAVSSSSST